MVNLQTLCVDKDLVAIGCLDGIIKIFSLSTNSCICDLMGHSSAVGYLCYFGNGMIASGCDEPLISFWNIGKQIRERLFRHHRLRISGLTCTAHNELMASASIDGSISTYNCRSMALVNTWFLPDKVPISCIHDYSNERLLFVLTWARLIYLYEPYDGECRQKWDLPWITQIGSLSSSGYFLGLKGNETITSYDFRFKEDISYPLSLNRISSFSDDSSLISLGFNDGSISVHNKDAVNIERVTIQNGYIECIAASTTGVSLAYSNGLIGFVEKCVPEYKNDGPHEITKQKATNIIDLYHADGITTALYKPGRLLMVWCHKMSEMISSTISIINTPACQVAHSLIKCATNRVIVFVRNRRHVGMVNVKHHSNVLGVFNINDVPEQIHKSENDDVEYFRIGKLIFDDKFIHVVVVTNHPSLFIYKVNVIEFGSILINALPGTFDDVALVYNEAQTLTLATICKNATNPGVSLWQMANDRYQIFMEIGLSVDPPVALIDNIVILQSGTVQKYRYTSKPFILRWQFKIEPGEKYAYSPSSGTSTTERDERLYILRKGKCFACNLPPLGDVLPRVNAHSNKISAVGLTNDKKHLISCSQDGLLISTKLDSWNDGNEFKVAHAPIDVNLSVINNNLHCAMLFLEGKFSIWQKPLNASKSEWKLHKTYNLPIHDIVYIYRHQLYYEGTALITKRGYLFYVSANGDWSLEKSISPVIGRLALTKDNCLLTVQTSTSHPFNCKSVIDYTDGWNVKCQLVDYSGDLCACFSQYITRFIVSPDGKVGAALSSSLREIEFLRLKKTESNDSDNESDSNTKDKESDNSTISKMEKYDHVMTITLENVADVSISPIRILNEHCICMANTGNKDVILVGDCQGRLIMIETTGDFPQYECKLISQSHTSDITCVGFTQKSQLVWTGSTDYTVKCRQILCPLDDERSYLVSSPPLFITTCLKQTDEVIVSCANGDVFPL